MYRLLIVDDEPIIVDGLYALFMDGKNLNLDVYKAYSAKKAIAWLDRTKIDIVLTDIQMPGMSGLQLMKEINSRWPLCKVIFLTAHSEFDYVYTAMQYSVASYVLKTEGEQAVLRAVEKCIDEINQSISTRELIHKAEEQMQVILPFLQKEFLMDILQSEKYSIQIRQEQFKKLNISLDAGFPVMLLVGSVDNYSTDTMPFEKAQRVFEIDTVFQKYLAHSIDSVYITWDHGKLLWFIQPKRAVRDENESILWKNTVLFVKGTLETIQLVCKESLNISMSLILDNRPSSWDEIGKRFNFLKQIINLKIGYSSEMSLMESSFFNNEFIQYTDDTNNTHNEQLHNAKLDMLKSYLESSRREEFFKLLTEMVEFILQQDDSSSYFKLEAYHSISLMFLSYINRFNLKDIVANKINMVSLMGTRELIAHGETIENFYKLGEVIFTHQKSQQIDRMDILISNINEYINKHLNEDLSLVTLSEKVHLNPVYLSRVYKQATGVNLSDYISDIRICAAKKLLELYDLKIHEIGVSVGYESAAYFTRVFKQLTHMTPKEYRDTTMKNKLR